MYCVNDLLLENCKMLFAELGVVTPVSELPTLSEVDLGIGRECRKSGVKSVASRGVGSPVLRSDTSTLFRK